MQAASQASGEIAEMLIAAGADINAKDTQGRTPLIIAAEFGNAEVAGVLIQARADVNAKDNNGNIDDFKFVDDFFKSQDAYVPAWGSSGRNNGAGKRITLRVIGLDPEDIERMDFIALLNKNFLAYVGKTTYYTNCNQHHRPPGTVSSGLIA